MRFSSRSPDRLGSAKVAMVQQECASLSRARTRIKSVAVAQHFDPPRPSLSADWYSEPQTCLGTIKATRFQRKEFWLGGS